MKLVQAQNLAQRIVDSMAPFCERVAVAGSIRRCKPEVKDIEIVAIPRRGEATDLFNEHPSNALCEWAREIEQQNRIWWIKPGTHEVIRWHVAPDGKYWRGWLVKAEIKLDLFLCSPENWGATYLVRTGSSQFNVQLFTRARMAGYQFAYGHLYNARGRVVATPEEADIFDLIGLDFIEPRLRTGEQPLWR